jgi:hypothetical protein
MREHVSKQSGLRSAQLEPDRADAGRREVGAQPADEQPPDPPPLPAVLDQRAHLVDVRRVEHGARVGESDEPGPAGRRVARSVHELGNTRVLRRRFPAQASADVCGWQSAAGAVEAVIAGLRRTALKHLVQRQGIGHPGPPDPNDNRTGLRRHHLFLS